MPADQWGYPDGFIKSMWSWRDQVNFLLRLYPHFEVEGLEEQAESYLDNKNIWAKRVLVDGVEYPLWDALVVFPKPESILGLDYNNFWAFPLRGNKIRSLLVRVTSHSYGQLRRKREYSNLANRNNVNRMSFFRPTIEWLRSICQSTPGDLICRPFSFGRATVNWRVDSILNKNRREELKIVPAPSWITAFVLLVCPPRFIDDHDLWLANSGDRYPQEVTHKAEFCTFCYYINGKFNIGTTEVERKYPQCGIALLHQ